MLICEHSFSCVAKNIQIFKKHHDGGENSTHDQSVKG